MVKPLFFLHLFVGSIPAHPYYVSICDLVINAQTQTLQVTTKVFLDDLERALIEKGLFAGKYDWKSSDEDQKEKQLNALKEYLNATFLVQFDEQKTKMNLLGYEAEQDVLYVYMESEILPEKVGKLHIELTFLTREIPEQMNILHVNREGSKKSYLLHQSETKMDW